MTFRSPSSSEPAMTTFLSALRAEFLASVPSTCISNDSKKDSQLLQSSSFSPSNRTVTRHRTFQDPFVSSEISHRDILKILQVNDTTQGQTIKYKSQKESLKTLKRQDGSKINNVIEVLLTLCHTHLETNRSNEVFTSFELAQSILQSIQENRDLETLQAHLFNLLGAEGMELIAFAVQNQKELLSKQKLDELQKMLRQQEKKTQRQASREIRKEANEENWLEAAGYDLEVVRLQREAVDHERRLESSSLIQREFGTLQGGYDSTGAAGQLMSAGVLTLPSSTKRTYFKGYEHVFIPAHAKKPLEKEDPLVEIASLDDFAQTAFHGISTLNRLQSKLFHAAYHSNQNLLVCAPTGAGKTNVAMLTILQEVKTQYIRSKDERSVSFTQRLAKIKIIYVAPMKALAQEVVTKFSERLRELKLQVRELTGDMQLTKREIDETHVIVTTPEKWDVITRKSGTQQSLLSQVKVLIIDEVHLLADERGPVIETIVARTLRRVESTQCMIRIVGLSATLPNYVDVATFLRVSVPSGDVRMQNAATNGGQGGLFYFDATYRPVPLDQTFIGVSTNGNLKDAVTLNTTALTTSFENEDEMMKDKKGTNTMSRQRQIELMMNKLTLAHCLKQVQAKEQVMVFVHSRKETGRTMRTLIELARGHEEEMKTLEAFLPPIELQLDRNLHERVLKSRNQEVKELLGYGLGIHHAGMLRSDRNLTEELFERGYIRVLCCTATLAWGVNLPAHSVLIKGTQVYNAAKGGITQLSILDVMQIFGRAGRPQYDTRGDAVLLTTQDNLAHYLRLLTTGLPMESALIQALPDHLNAEIVSNTITNLDEACTWLSYTYLYVRMRKNPLAYGMKWDDVQHDPMLVARRRQLILAAAEKLAACRMIKISREKGQKAVNGEPQVTFTVTSVGRVASHYYIQHTSIETFHELFEASSEEEDTLNWDTVFRFLCSSHEFEQLKSREDEMTELEQLQHRYCRYAIVGGGLDTSPGKTNILLQSLLSRGRISSFTLISDSNYVAQNGARVARALFEICLKKSRGNYAAMFLQLAKCIDQKLWFDQTPLLQFSNVPFAIIHELEHQSLYDAMIDPQACNLSSKALKWIQSLPFLDITNVQTQPVGKTMLKVTFELTPLFLEWKEGVFQGKTLASWIWIEDGLNGYIYHSEYYILHQARFLTWKARAQSLELECFLPVFLSQTQQEVQYVIRIFSDRFVGIESFYYVSYTPVQETQSENQMSTSLLQLHPQPLESLENHVYQSLYQTTCSHLNRIQTQMFYKFYHTQENLLLCAPTGSGKTLCAEIAMFRVWNSIQRDTMDCMKTSCRSLIVYLAPMQALVREKVMDWTTKFTCHSELRKKIVEVSNETLVNMEFLLNQADLVVSTCEKWDQMTRNPFVAQKLMSQIALVIVDEVHLLNEPPYGPVFELILSRIRRFQTDHPFRIIALSSSLANANDVGRWLNTPTSESNVNFAYNFHPSVRPIPLEMHVQGFPERHYVARMAAMNKPTFMLIQTHAVEKPVLIFVSSKAQTKVTALDLIQFSMACDDTNTEKKGFLSLDEDVMHSICLSNQIIDETLKHTLAFGIGLYHVGLLQRERQIVEKLYREGGIQIVISTSNFAWGMPLSASLVVLKGIESFENGRYCSYPLSDILQMIGRAGRPNVDEKGIVCVLVEEGKKNRTQRFLYEPIAMESCLNEKNVVNDVNAEIVAGAIHSRKEVMEYLTWTYLFQRVLTNPRYYGLVQFKEQDTDDHKRQKIELFFDKLITTILDRLVSYQCLILTQNATRFEPTFAGKVAASLYIDVRTISNLLTALKTQCTNAMTEFETNTLQVLCIVCESCVEFDQVPVRHHEILSNLLLELCGKVKYSPLKYLYARGKKQPKRLVETHGSQVKAMVILQMYLMRMRFPSSDFRNDLRIILDFLPRLLRAVIHLCAYIQLPTFVRTGIRLEQAVVQGRWPDENNTLAQFPHVSPKVKKILNDEWKVSTLLDFQTLIADKTKKKTIVERLQNVRSQSGLTNSQVHELIREVEKLPQYQVNLSVHSNELHVLLTQKYKKRKQVTCTTRLHYPKAYGLYVLITKKTNDDEMISELKHVPYNEKILLRLTSSALDTEYRVHVLSDAIAGLESLHCLKL